jgi:hypothetical protein
LNENPCLIFAEANAQQFNPFCMSQVSQMLKKMSLTAMMMLGQRMPVDYLMTKSRKGETAA